MKNKIRLVILSLVPLLFGNILNVMLFNMQVNAVVFIVFGLVTYLYMFFLGYMSLRLTDSISDAFMIGNGPGLIALLILLLSGIFTGSYLLNPIGTQAQLYFLPVLHLSKRLIFFTTNVHTNLLFIIAFITMFVMFVIGNKMAFDNR